MPKQWRQHYLIYTATRSQWQFQLSKISQQTVMYMKTEITYGTPLVVGDPCDQTWFELDTFLTGEEEIISLVTQSHFYPSCCWKCWFHCQPCWLLFLVGLNLNHPCEFFTAAHSGCLFVKDIGLQDHITFICHELSHWHLEGRGVRQGGRPHATCVSSSRRHVKYCM
jgi:hypothetical protein